MTAAVTWTIRARAHNGDCLSLESDALQKTLYAHTHVSESLPTANKWLRLHVQLLGEAYYL